MKSLLFGSFLLAYKLQESEILELFGKTQSITTMYLISCSLAFTATGREILLRNHTLMSIHIFESFISSHFLLAASSKISQYDRNPCVVINCHTLSDQMADKYFTRFCIGALFGIVLVVSATKVQGVVKTSSLYSYLSNLEMLNLTWRIWTLCSSCLPDAPSWDHHLQWYGHKSEGIIEAFVKVLVLYKKISGFQLKIGLVEGNTLIAHAMKTEEFNDIIASCNDNYLSSIYLSSCFISSNGWNNIINNYSIISSLCLHMINCQVKVFKMLLTQRTIMLRELFVHCKGSVHGDDIEAIPSAYYHASVVVVTRDTIAVCNPTNKQLAIAHQLEPSVTIWKFFRCKLNADTCQQIVILLIHAKLINELKFIGCDIGKSEIGLYCNQLVTIKRPTLPLKKITHFKYTHLITQNNKSIC